MEVKTVPASMEYLDEALIFIEELLEQIGFDENGKRLAAISSEEIFTNIVSYAYEVEGEGEIEISFEQIGEKARIRFKDSGIPYDPLTRDDPDFTKTIDERPIGGLGIYMVKKFMDHVHYERVDGCNIIEIEKNK